MVKGKKKKEEILFFATQRLRKKMRNRRKENEMKEDKMVEMEREGKMWNGKERKRQRMKETE